MPWQENAVLRDALAEAHKDAEMQATLRTHPSDLTHLGVIDYRESCGYGMRVKDRVGVRDKTRARPRVGVYIGPRVRVRVMARATVPIRASVRV